MSRRFVAALLLALASAAPAVHAQSRAVTEERLAALLESVRPDSRVEMFYLSAPDCPYCAHWESRAKSELLASPAGRAVRYVEIHGETLRMPITERHYPTEFRWVFEQVGPTRGVPRFLLAIDGKIVLGAIGTGGYANRFLPVLRAVVARRETGKS